MGNILNSQPDINLINHLNNFHIKVLNKKEHEQLEKLKFENSLRVSNISLFTTYSYQTIDQCLRTNFILCKSLTIDEIIENIFLGKESISYFLWNHFIRKKGTLYIKDILGDPFILSNKIDLIEMHSIVTSKSCKTLRNHPNLKMQDDQTYFSENDIIDGIMANFVIYPIKKILLLNILLLKQNILDVKLNILNLYIKMLYSF